MRRSGARRANTARPGALATRPPGDTSGVGLAESPDLGSGRTERPMDAIIKPWPLGSNSPLSEHVRNAPEPGSPRPSREQAEAPERTLIAYIGDNPDREGLLDTRKRVVGAYEELYRGYRESPVEARERTFSETGNYDDLVLVRDISFNSACEHHMMQFTGKAHVAYMPVDKVVGLSKLARLVDVYARRLQTQEHMTSQVATAIDEILKPRGVAGMMEAEHMCMGMRGVQKPGIDTVTTQFTGLFRDDAHEQVRFLTLVRGQAR